MSCSRVRWGLVSTRNTEHSADKNVAKSADDSTTDLIERTAELLRAQLVLGQLLPGEQLRETGLTQELNVSRNTLREAFRVLIHEGLLERIPNRGVFVRQPTTLDVIDIFRVRRMIEVQSILQSVPGHRAIAAARRASDEAQVARDREDWGLVGTKNLEFHGAIVALADSPRLNTLFAHMQAEIRLAFTADPEVVYGPFVESNAHIITLIEEDRLSDAAAALNTYFDRSERMALASLAGL